MNGNYQDGWIVALLALMVPIILMAAIIIPIYAGALIGLYFIYDDVVLQIWHDYDAVIYTYQQLYAQYEAYEVFTLTNFIIPRFSSLFIGCLAAIFAVIKFIAYVRSVFNP